MSKMSPLSPLEFHFAAKARTAYVGITKVDRNNNTHSRSGSIRFLAFKFVPMYFMFVAVTCVMVKNKIFSSNYQVKQVNHVAAQVGGPKT